MELYLVEEDNMKRVPESALATEENLEQRLVRTEGARIGGVEILYVARQESPGEGGIFDILGVDERGDTVIVELKRDRAPRDIVTQALEYAGEIRNVEYDYLNEQYKQFLQDEQAYEHEEVRPLRDAHADYFDLEDALSPREFNDEQRLVVVGTSFQDVSLNMADFLREHGIDVVAVEYTTYRDEDKGVELLSTDGIRRPLSEEPTTASSSSTPSGTDYTEFITRVGNRLYQKADSKLAAESPDDLTGSASRRFGCRGGHPDHPQAPLYGFIPRIEEEGKITVRLGVHGRSDEEKQRGYETIINHVDDLDGFEQVAETPKAVIIAKEIEVTSDDPYAEEVVEETASELARLIEFYHPKFIEAESNQE